jgi:putative redox protein
MKIQLTSTADESQYIGMNERGQQILLSGNQSAVSPMEAVLMAASACSTIDVELLLKKMRQDVSRVEVHTEGTRAEAVPAVFTSIHIHYRIFGNIREEKAVKAVAMSLEKYCSVSIMLSATVAITHSVEVITPS